MKIRLEKAAFIGGMLYQKGDVVDLPAGVAAPKTAKEVKSILSQARPKAATAAAPAAVDVEAEDAILAATKK